MRLQDISFFLFFCSVFVFKWTCFRHENIQWMASFCFWSCFDFPPYSSVFWWVIPSFCKYIFLHLIGAYRSVYRSCVWLSYTHWFIYNHRFKIIKETNKKKSLHICTDIPNFPIYIQSDQIIYLTVHNKLTYLFLSVRELHTNSKMEEPPRKQLNKKLNHLVLGPAAGQGLSNRLQCQGSFIKVIWIMFLILETFLLRIIWFGIGLSQNLLLYQITLLTIWHKPTTHWFLKKW